ncbi:unnamed protein product, partial [Symbiodinium microadriaticum]
MCFAHVGVEDCEAMKGLYVDAQGNPLRTAGVRIAEVQVGQLRFRERFVISDVTMPLISLGKLYRAGWYVLPDDGGLKLTNGRQGEAVCFKKQSLCIRGSIRIVQNQVIRAVTDVQLGSALSSLPIGSDPESSSGSQMSVDFPDGVPDLEQIAAEAASTQQSDVVDVLLPAIPEAVQLSENPRPQKQPRLETSTISMISTAGEKSSGVDLIVGCEEMPCVAEIRKVTYTHEDESVELAFDQDAIDDMEDYDYEEYNDDQIGDAGDLDQRLCRPRDSDVEPECGEEEMRVLDSIADQVEITRLKSMSMLQDPASMDLSQAVHLTTKMVRTWRQKETGNPPVPVWYRRSRYVAREYAWLSERTDLFSPASSSLCNRLLPILFMYNKSKDDNDNISDDDKLSLFAVDIGDAFLTVPQVRPTYVTYVHPDGSKELFYLGFVLPGQRSGSSDWYDDFTKFLSANLNIIECPAHPSLVKTADPTSRFAMQLHVDDMLGFAKRKFVHETSDAGDQSIVLESFSDSNWASCKGTR